MYDQQSRPADITVIGAGVIGVSAALALQARGYDTTLLDREGVAAGASFGNAGAFAFSDIVPLATPGIMRSAPKWLLDPLGPLSIPPSYALSIAPWLLRFWRASWCDRYQAAMTAQSALMAFSRAAFERQVADAGAAHLLQHDGQLQLYEGKVEFEASLPTWDARSAAGITFHLLQSQDEIAEIQPGLAARFTHAGFVPDWINVCDPAVWVRHLADQFVARGGRIERAAVTGLAEEGDHVRLETETVERRAAQVVVAAGAWSHRLARTLGEKLPLETERGYNTTLPEGAFDLRTHLTFGGHGFVVTRINGGVRIGGAVELGGLNLPPNYRRATAQLDKAKTFLSGPRRRRRQAMDGVSPFHARQPAGDRQVTAGAPHHLRFRPWPSRVDPIRRHRRAGGRSCRQRRAPP